MIDYPGFAAAGYHAYGATTGHKNYQGNPMPTWEELPQPQKDAWIMAAATIRNMAVDALYPLTASTYDPGPQHSFEALADIAAVDAIGTRVVVNNFAAGHALPGLITQDPGRSDVGYVVVLDNETTAGVKTIALRPTVADAIRDYQIVSEAVALGKELSLLTSAAPESGATTTSGSEPLSTSASANAGLPTPSSSETSFEALAPGESTGAPTFASADTTKDATAGAAPSSLSPSPADAPVLAPNGNAIVTQTPKTSAKPVRK